jgi:hypothetical protein
MFLEKIADMFEEITYKLPAYAQFVSLITDRIKHLDECESRIQGDITIFKKEKGLENDPEVDHGRGSAMNTVTILSPDELESSRMRESLASILKSLSFVYLDIIQFCHEAFRLFSTKRRG